MCNDIKDYTAEDTIYTYKGIGILKNKFNIKKLDELRKQEIFFTSIRITELHLNSIKGVLNFEYLKKIHYYIFQDVYDFAGQIRKVDIEKGHSKFCCFQYIEDEAKRIFDKLERENFFTNYDHSEYCEKIAEFMGDLIALHPFREGNGRANREFFRNLCLKAGYELNYELFDKEKILEADIALFNCDKKPILQLMEKGLLRKIDLSK